MIRPTCEITEPQQESFIRYGGMIGERKAIMRGHRKVLHCTCLSANAPLPRDNPAAPPAHIERVTPRAANSVTGPIKYKQHGWPDGAMNFFAAVRSSLPARDQGRIPWSRDLLPACPGAPPIGSFPGHSARPCSRPAPFIQGLRDRL